MTDDREESAREHERRAREHEPAERSPAGEDEAGETPRERDGAEDREGFRPPAAPPRGSPS